MHKQFNVKETGSPLADMERLNCLQSVNNLTDKQIKNLSKLVSSPKAKEYLESNIKFALLQKFI